MSLLPWWRYLLRLLVGREHGQPLPDAQLRQEAERRHGLHDLDDDRLLDTYLLQLRANLTAGDP